MKLNFGAKSLEMKFIQKTGRSFLKAGGFVLGLTFQLQLIMGNSLPTVYIMVIQSMRILLLEKSWKHFLRLKLFYL